MPPTSCQALRIIYKDPDTMKLILILSILLLTACADTHGFAGANNSGAVGGIDVVHMKFP